MNHSRAAWVMVGKGGQHNPSLSLSSSLSVVATVFPSLPLVHNIILPRVVTISNYIIDEPDCGTIRHICQKRSGLSSPRIRLQASWTLSEHVRPFRSKGRSNTRTPGSGFGPRSCEYRSIRSFPSSGKIQKDPVWTFSYLLFSYELIDRWSRRVFRFKRSRLSRYLDIEENLFYIFYWVDDG